MKKSNAHYFILAALILCSVCSYVFLATRSVSTPEIGVQTSKEITIDKEKKEVEEGSKSLLPDVKMVKKLADAARRLLPASAY